MKYTLILLILVGCASDPQIVNQELVIDKKIQGMGRQEVIEAISQCESSKQRAVLLFGKRKINGYTTELVVDVTCAPKYF
jgi:hypothetical protein